METIARRVVWFSLCCLVAVFVAVEANPAAAAEPLTNEAMAALIEQLVLTDKDTVVMNGQSYLSREGVARIQDAGGQLVAEGKNAWPVLFAHLKDMRHSIVPKEVAGPHTVGMKCYFMLEAQIMDLPRGYPYQKTLAADNISFRPNIETWLKQRQHRTLDEIRYEVLSILIDMERYTNERKAVDLLQPHLAIIEERIKRAAENQQSPQLQGQRTSPMQGQTQGKFQGQQQPARPVPR